MKPASALLAASLVANAALVGAFVLRSPSGSPALNTASSGASSATSASRAASTNASADALQRALASGDLAALEAAGIPPELAREILLGRAFAKFGERMRAVQAKKAAAQSGRWWRNTPAGGGAREEELLAQRELSAALSAAFGDDFGIGGLGGDLSFLPAAKRDALRRITQDYSEMMAKFSAGGIQLPSDRERLKLLREERDRDIASLLTPAEFADYELRTSATAANLRARYGDGIESEDDFRKLYALQKTFDEKFPRDAMTGRVTPEQMQARAAAEKQLQVDIASTLGADKYAALRRASDFDLRNVDSLASRLNLPANTTDQVVATRDTFAAQSQRINSDTSLTPQQRRAQITDLAGQAKGEVTRTLGAEAGEAYAQRSPWLNMLSSGMAYSTDPNTAGPNVVTGGGQSVFPVMPAGAGGPGAVRQTVMIGDTATAVPASGGSFLFSGSGQPMVENRQVISVVTNSQSQPNTPAGGAAPGTGTTTPPANQTQQQQPQPRR